jgi:VCBS repeat-containing protein
VTSRYFAFGLVNIRDYSRRITVEDCAALDPKGTTAGGRRYSFTVDESDSILWQRCLTRGGRHDFASSSRVQGPNVFVDCRATETYNDIGPHHRYSTGQLYDNIFGGEMNVQNRTSSGSGHGWSGAQIMFWNCDASSIICDAPTGAMNWVVGSSTYQAESARTPAEPFGIWDSLNQAVNPRSLYYAQLADRLGANALNSVILPQQKEGNVWDALLLWDGDGLFLDDVIAWADEETFAKAGVPLAIGGAVRNLQMLGRGNFTYLWSQVSGSGLTTFTDNTALETTATFDQVGTYVLNLLVDDGTVQASANVTVDVFDAANVPIPPTNLIATAGESSVTLDWDDNGEPDLTSYSVYRSETSDGSGYVLIATGVGLSEYVDNTSVDGTTYYYVVKAVDSDGDESVIYSNESTATPVADPPAEPTGLVAIADDGSVTLDWDDNIEPDLASYNVYRSETPGSYGTTPLPNSPSSSNYVDDTAANGTTYYYVVKAVDSNSYESGDSNEVSATPIADTTPPAEPTGLVAIADDGSVTLNWDDNGEPNLASYTVYRKETTGSYTAIATNVSLSTYVDSGLTNGTSYYYVVTAVDFEGNESANDNELFATPQVPISLVDVSFGTNNDGLSGFTTSTPNPAQEAWSIVEPDSVRYINDDPDGIPDSGIDGATENSSLLQEFILDRSVGKRYIIEGVVDLTDGYADDNNRLGIYLFGDVDDLTGAGGPEEDESGALCLIYNFDKGQVGLYEGIDFNLIPAAIASNGRAEDNSIFGPNNTVTFTAEISFVELNGTTQIQIVGSFEDESGVITTLSPQIVIAADYTGDYFGFATRARNRGVTADGSERNAPFTMDYKRFSITGNSTPVNGPPVFRSNTIDEVAATEGAAYSSTLVDDASDPESDPMTFSKISGPTWLSVASDGTLSGTPTNDDVGLNSFTVKVEDATGSSQATLEITVNNVNDAPVAVDDSFVTAENTELNGNLFADNGNGADFDIDGDTLEVASNSNPGKGSVTVNIDGTFIYTPNNGSSGTDTFTYTITDSTAESAFATVSVTINAVPVANADSYSADEGDTLTVPAAGVLTNDTDADHDPLTLTASLITGPSNSATFTLNDDGSFNYTHDGSETTSDSFTYVANDGISDSAEAAVTITINPVNDPPAFDSDPIIEVSAIVDSPYSGTLTASDPESDQMTFSLVPDPANPTWLIVDPDTGALSGTPSAGDLGINDFTVQVSATGGSDTAELRITVDTFQTETMFTNADGTDSFISNPANWSASLPTNGVTGTIEINAAYDSSFAHVGYDVAHIDGTLTKTGFNALTLGAGTTWEMNGATAEISSTRGINVTGATFTLNQGVADLTDNNRDSIIKTGGEIVINGGTMDIGRHFYFDEGNLTVNGGSLTGITDMGSRNYHSGGNADLNGGTIAATYLTFGTGSFNLNFGGTTPGSLTIENFGGIRANANAIGINFDPGTLMSLQLTVPVESGASGDGDLGWSKVGAETGLSWAETLWADGRLTYNGQNYMTLGTWATVTSTGLGDGTEFVYDSGTNTLSVTVSAVNEDPVALDDTGTTDEDTVLAVVAVSGVLSNDSDPDTGDSLTVTAFDVLSANGASVSVNADGSYTYDPQVSATLNALAVGSTLDDSFTYTISDGNDGSDTATVTITVTAVNDAPVAVGDSATATEDTPFVSVTDLDANDTDADGDALSVVEGTFATNEGGSITIAADGSYTYTPAADFSGEDTVNYTVSDGSLTDDGLLTIMVTAVNDAPSVSLANETASLPEDTNTTSPIKVADVTIADDGMGTNDLSLEDVSTFELIGTELFLKAGVVLDFETSPGLSVTVAVDDATVGETPDDSAVYTLTVTDVNEAPSVNLTPVVTDLAEDTDTSNRIKVADVAITDADSGTNELSLSGTDAGQFELDGLELFLSAEVVLDFETSTSLSVTVDVDDSTVGTTPDDSAAYALSITDVNEAPSVNLTPVVTDLPEDTDTTSPIKVADVTITDDGLGVNALSLSDVSTFELIGTELFLQAGVALDFETAPDLSVTVTVDDTTVGETPDDSAVYTLTVTDVNEAPVAVDDLATTDEDTMVVIDVLANDSDVDGDTLVIVSASAISGTINIVSDQLEYTANADYNGTDIIVYEISDGNGGNATTKVDVTVTAVNDAPVAVQEPAYTVNGDASIIAGASVLANDTDADADTLTAVLENDVANGTLTLNADGTFDYTPNADFNGSDSFTYFANDGTVNSASSAAVTITVTELNDAPAGVNDVATTTEDIAAIIDVLVNDSDVDGDTLVVSAVADGANGTVTNDGNGMVTYSPNADFSGTDSFTYTVDDSNGGTDTATVDVTVTAVNDAPSITSAAVTAVAEDTAYTYPVTTTDPDTGDSVTVSATTLPSWLTFDGVTLSGTPTNSEAGDHAVVLEATDSVLTDTQSFTITVSNVNAAPSITSAAVTAVAEDTTYTYTVTTTDPDTGDSVTVSATTLPLWLTFDGVILSGTPTNSEVGDHAVVLEATDSVLTDTQSYTITVRNLNDSPVAVQEPAYTVNEDASITAGASVLVNDTDADADTLTAVLENDVANGTLILNADGTFDYTPNIDFNGSDSFTYFANDGTVNSASSAAVTITVDPINDAPVAVQESAYTVNEDASIIAGASVLANDTDADADTLTAVLENDVANGTLTLNADGTFDYTPNADFNGSDSFTYFANDGTVNSASSAAVTITVDPINDAPVFSVDPLNAANATENAAYSDMIAGSATDTDGDTLTYSKVSGPDWLTVGSDGVLSGTPGSSDVGLNSWVVEVSDSNTGSAQATLEINVDADSTPPVAGPRLYTVEVTNVGSDWQTITLPETYTSPVIVATVVYDSSISNAPAVARVRNASGNSFELKVQNPSGASLSGYTVHIMVVEEGVYTDAEHGIDLEAIKVNSDGTNGRSRWSSSQLEQIAPSNSYINPVVLGQVMTENDVNWSVFWSCDGTRTRPARSDFIYVGKHVAEDSNNTRLDETLGVIILESGSGTLDGVNYTAGVGADNVRGIGNNAPYSYGLSGLSSASVALVSSAGMDGSDGGWAALFGVSPVSVTNLNLVIEEDQIRDAERSHTTEQVSYIVFE